MSEYRGSSDGDSSGDDSVLIEREGFRDVVDEEVPPTVWDEVIVNRATRAGFVSLDRVVDLNFQVEGICDEISTQILAWGVPFCNPSRFDGGGPWHRSW